MANNNISQLDYDDFGQRIGLTNGGLLKYFDIYYDFFQNQYPFIVRFFSGDLDRISSKYLESLNNLVTKAEDISNRIDNNSFNLLTYKDWEISDYLEDLKMELYRMLKTSKFLRSSKTNFNFSGKIEFNYSLASNQTIEDVSYKVLSSKSYDDDAVDIAIRSDLSEVDYNMTGGQSLVLSVELNSLNSQIQAVVDNIIGDKALGLDIKKAFVFINNDLEVLDYRPTALQSVEILSNLIKGDHPEYKDLGSTAIAGENYNSLQLPTFIREKVNTFSSDDTLTNFTIKNMKVEGDALFVNFTVNTVLDLVINQNIKI